MILLWCVPLLHDKGIQCGALYDDCIAAYEKSGLWRVRLQISGVLIKIKIKILILQYWNSRIDFDEVPLG
jgi:hypothetical protein